MKGRLVYITGYGRSGSTILDILLGSHDQVVGVGELGYLFRLYRDREERCSCGESLARCPFWSHVFDEALGPDALHRLDSLESIRERVEGWTAFWRLIHPGRLKQVGKSYIQFTGSLVHAIFRITGNAYLLDSTKGSYPFAWRALALQRLCGLDVRVIHLVRDGRGVMASKIKGDNRAMRRGRLSRNRAAGFRALFGWLSANAFSFITGLWLPSGHYLLVRYEEMIRHPERELRRIGLFLGLDMSTIIETIGRNGAFPNGHRMAGNRMAAEKEIRLQRGVPARPSLPFHLKVLYSLISWPIRICIRAAE